MGHPNPPTGPRQEHVTSRCGPRGFVEKVTVTAGGGGGEREGGEEQEEEEEEVGFGPGRRGMNMQASSRMLRWDGGLQG